MLAWARKSEGISTWRSLELFVVESHPPYPLVQRLVAIGTVRAFDKSLAIAKESHNSLINAIMVDGTDWDDSTPTEQEVKALPYPEKAPVIYYQS